jgi:hypothetical protein
MHDVVLAVPEFLKMYHGIGLAPEEGAEYPHVVADDGVGEGCIWVWTVTEAPGR